MYDPASSHLLFPLLIAQALGLASSVTARLSVGSRHQRKCQWMFVACLRLAGLSTIAALSLTPGAWLLCAGTFSVTILAATCDLSRSRRTTAWEWTP